MVAFFTSEVVCEEKLWLPNLEWEVADNWQGSQVPDANSRIKFPVEMRHTVGLPFGTFKFSGIDLSRDGSLAFNKNSRIEVDIIFHFHSLMRTKGAFYSVSFYLVL